MCYEPVTVGLKPSLKQISALSQEGEMTLDTANQVTQPSDTSCVVISLMGNSDFSVSGISVN